MSFAGRRGGTIRDVKMKPIWVWTQAIIVAGTVAGMVIAIVKLA